MWESEDEKGREEEGGLKKRGKEGGKEGKEGEGEGDEREGEKEWERNGKDSL